MFNSDLHDILFKMKMLILQIYNGRQEAMLNTVPIERKKDDKKEK